MGGANLRGFPFLLVDRWRKSFGRDNPLYGLKPTTRLRAR